MQGRVREARAPSEESSKRALTPFTVTRCAPKIPVSGALQVFTRKRHDQNYFSDFSINIHDWLHY